MSIRAEVDLNNWRFPCCFVFTIVILSFAVRLDAQQTWTQWRGPDRNGLLSEADWPATLSGEHLISRWSTKLGPSYSGPLVTKDTVYTTATREKKWEVVIAVDLETGKKRWETKWEGAMSVPFFARSNGDWIRATPALHRGKLYVAGMRDVLVCLDIKNGEVIWKKDFVKELRSPLPTFGYVSSPLPDGDYLYVQAGGGILKLEAETGKIVWHSMKDGGGMFGSAFSSPTIDTLHGARQLLIQSRKVLAGVDLETGDVLWSKEIEAFRGMNILTPCRYKSGFFVSSYGGGTLYFEVQKTDKGYATVERWRKTAQGYMSTPILIGKYAYLHMRNQRVTCFDIETGQQTWTSTPFGKYWSMISDGEKILALDEKGILYMIAANPEKFELLGTHDFNGSSSWAHLGIMDNKLVVRELDKVVCYHWSKPAPGDDTK